MPIAPRRNSAAQFPPGADLMSGMDGDRARLTIHELGYATFAQQARLLTMFDVTVDVPATMEQEEMFDPFLRADNLIQTVPVRHREAMRFAIRRGSSVTEAWDMMAPRLDPDMLIDFHRAAADQGAETIYRNLLHRFGGDGPRPGDIAMFNNDRPGVVNGWLRPSGHLGARPSVHAPTMDAIISDLGAAVSTAAPAVRAASDAMTGLSAAMTAPAINLPEGATRYHARVVHDQPEALARVTAPNRVKAIHDVDPTSDDVRAAGLVEALITSESVPTRDAMDRTAKGLQNWLKNVYGVEVHTAVLRQTTAVLVKMARPVILRQQRHLNRVKAELVDANRHVREMKDVVATQRARLAELEEGPRATPEQAAKASRYDEAMAVALEWEQAPKGGVEKLNAFRKLHHTLTVIATESATIAAALAEVDELAAVVGESALITGIPAEFAIAG